MWNASHSSPQATWRAAEMVDGVGGDTPSAAGYELGLGVWHPVNVMYPSMVVIGGPLSRSPRYLDAVWACVERRTLRAERVPVVRSTLGREASLLGDFQLAIEGKGRSCLIADIRTPSS